MRTLPQRIYLLPGPELERLISDQADKLQKSFPQIDNLRFTLWVEDLSGFREKICEVLVHSGDKELRVTKRGATHILAIRDATRTLKQRISRMFLQNK